MYRPTVLQSNCRIQIDYLAPTERSRCHQSVNLAMANVLLLVIQDRAPGGPQAKVWTMAVVLMELILVALILVAATS